MKFPVKVLLSIIALLSDPNPSDPINWEAARVLREKGTKNACKKEI